MSGELVPSVRPGIEVMMEREPVGVVGLITPWNFPIAIPAWKIAPALAYGNTVVFKPADLVPGCGWALADILNRAGLPKGVFNLVMGRGSVVGQAILDSPDVNAISFTGSVETGKRVAKASAEHMRHFQLEMGGKNPLVVLDDADLKTAVECAANGAFFSTGQRCTASSRLVVTEGIHDRFVGALIERMQGAERRRRAEGRHAYRPGGRQEAVRAGRDYIDVGREEGAKLAWGGERLNRATPGFYLQPALFTETKNDMRINREEIFGPVASVIRVKDYDEALAVANDTPFGLSVRHLHDQPEIRDGFPQEQRGRHGDDQPADGGRRLSRALRRPQRLVLRPARAGPLRGGVLHDGEDDLHAAGLTRAAWNDPAALIGVDWGTSNFRAFLLDAAGNVLDRRSGPHGILTVERRRLRRRAFAQIGDWLEADKPPVLMSGMIGSRQGWLEAPYLTCPAGIADLAAALVPVPFDAAKVHIVPGLEAATATMRDVMRGEETQVFGALARLGADGGRFLLPGTHSKWVLAEAGRITGFTTYMTGEIFAALREHTILGRLMAESAGDAASFARGVRDGARDGHARRAAEPSLRRAHRRAVRRDRRAPICRLSERPADRRGARASRPARQPAGAHHRLGCAGRALSERGGAARHHGGDRAVRLHRRRLRGDRPAGRARRDERRRAERRMDLHEALAALPLVAILRGIKPEEAEAIGAALVEAGLPPDRGAAQLARSVPLDRDCWRERFGERALIGGGTVMSPEAARTASSTPAAGSSSCRIPTRT